MSTDNLEGQPLNQEEISQDIPEAGEDLESKNKQLYARLQRENESREELESELNQFKSKQVEQPKSEPIGINPLDSIELYNAVKDLDKDEIAIASRFAKADGKDIKEVASSDEFRELIEARREKKLKDNAGAKPSTNNPQSERNVDDFIRDGNFKDCSPQDFAKLKAEMDRKFSRK